MTGLWYDPGIFLTGGKRSKLRKLENALQQQIVFVRLADIALQRYHIEGLEDTLNERTILQSLLWYGSVVFFEKDGNIFALPGTPTGDGYNVYGDPGSAWVYSRYNGKMFDSVKLYIPGGDKATFLKELIGSRQTGKPTGVIVWENRMRYPFINTVAYFSKCISDCYRTLDITRYWLKRPLILTGPEENSESIKVLIEGMEDNPSAVYLKSMLGVQKDATLLNTNANGQNLQDVTGVLEWYENKFRELCGVQSNSQMDKKGENLITAEITVNDQYEQLSIDKSLDEIQKGLDNVNEFFGLHLSVQQAEATKEKLNVNKDIPDVGTDKPGSDTKPE